MGTLIGIAFVAGLVTALSPCVLPVLPVVFAGSATGSARRPYAVIAGLVVSFTAFTLAATLLLDALGLPNDLLRNIAIAVVIVVALSLVFPQLARIVERPFAALGRRAPRGDRGGFVLGLSLGLLFTPCAGPIIAAVSVVAATREFSVEAVFITLAYALGAGVVLLAIAIAAQRGLALPSLRSRAPQIRQGLGVLMVAVAIVMILGLDARLASTVPGYTQALQGLEEKAPARPHASTSSLKGVRTRSTKRLRRRRTPRPRLRPPLRPPRRPARTSRAALRSRSARPRYSCSTRQLWARTCLTSAPHPSSSDSRDGSTTKASNSQTCAERSC